MFCPYWRWYVACVRLCTAFRFSLCLAMLGVGMLLVFGYVWFSDLAFIWLYLVLGYCLCYVMGCSLCLAIIGVVM